MADNIPVTPGSGSTIAADDVSGVLHQRVKVTLGVDGISDGDVSSSNPMPITVSSLPLPSGAATSALQTQPGVDIGDVTINNAAGASAVNIQDGGNSITVDGTVAATQSGTWNITNVSGTVSLPTGASTSALQTTGNTSLSSIDTKTPALGQALAAASTPVVLTAAQVTTLTPPTSVGLNAGANIIGSLTANQSVNLAQIAGAATSTGNGVAGTGVQRVTIASDNTAFSVNAAQSGTWTVQPGNTANTTAWKVDGSAVTQPVSAASLPLPAGAATSALQTTGNTSLATIVTNTTGALLTQGSSTSGQSGHLIQAAVTTTAPTYTTAQTNPLSLTTSGALRVDGSAVTQPVALTDGSKATYRASIIGLVTATTATDIFTITGSATKTIRVCNIGVTATQTTGGFEEIVILKRSTANSAGTSTTPIIVPLDSNNAAGTAVVRAYTANPTLGTLIGNIQTSKQFIPSASGGASTSYSQPITYSFGDKLGNSVVLRGTAQVVAINLNSITQAGSSYDLWVEWTEE